ncbi:MAG: hypothetical protein HYY52_04340 [Candidatus Melainabacteria bacterium]|nr:hypothetical protein [Candidatus Melainabacteria bacterium]
MLKKSKLVALTLVISMLLPLAALADEASSGCKKPNLLTEWTIGLPFKLVGATLSSATGLLVGTTTGIVRGAIKGTKAVAGALGDEDGAVETLAGLAVGAAPGAAVHGLLGGTLWTAKGFQSGFEKPFSCQSLHSAFEGIPDSVEWTAEGASKAFSS